MPTSTINPAVPASGASLSSAAIRANFQAAVNDINALYNYFDTDPTLNSITGGDSSLLIVGFSGASAGEVIVKGGTATTATVAGGSAYLRGGVNSTNGNGGDAVVTGGDSAGAHNGGDARLIAGTGGDLAATGNGGAVTILAGDSLASNGNGGDVTIAAGAGAGSGTTGLVSISGSAVKVGASQTTANGSVATGLTSVGPTGSHTTVQEWLVIQNSAGTARYIPCF